MEIKLCATTKFILQDSKESLTEPTTESSQINLCEAYETIEAHLTGGLDERGEVETTLRYADYSVQFTLRPISLLSWQCVTTVESYGGCKLVLASTNAGVKVYEDNRIVLSTELVSKIGKLNLSGRHVKEALISVCLNTCLCIEAPLPVSEDDILCDCCGFNFGHDYDDLYHVSGTLDDENNNHIHLCADCMETQGAPLVAVTSAKTVESSKPFDSLDDCYGCGHEFHNDYRNAHYYKTVMADESMDAGTLVVLCETCDCTTDFSNLEDAETKDA